MAKFDSDKFYFWHELVMCFQYIFIVSAFSKCSVSELILNAISKHKQPLLRSTVIRVAESIKLSPCQVLFLAYNFSM